MGEDDIKRRPTHYRMKSSPCYCVNSRCGPRNATAEASLKTANYRTARLTDERTMDFGVATTDCHSTRVRHRLVDDNVQIAVCSVSTTFKYILAVLWGATAQVQNFREPVPSPTVIVPDTTNNPVLCSSVPQPNHLTPDGRTVPTN